MTTAQRLRQWADQIQEDRRDLKLWMGKEFIIQECRRMAKEFEQLILEPEKVWGPGTAQADFVFRDTDGSVRKWGVACHVKESYQQLSDHFHRHRPGCTLLHVTLTPDKKEE